MEKRSSSPEFKIARTLKSIERDFGLKPDDSQPQTRPKSIGHHSDERIRKRVEDKYLHIGSPELEARHLLESRSHSRGGSRGASRGDSRGSSRGDRVLSPIEKHLAKLPATDTSLLAYKPFEKIPNARLGFGNSIADNTTILGSTQMIGECPGDFCNFQLSNLESRDTAEVHPDIKNLKAGKSISDFRKRLLANASHSDSFFSQESLLSRAMNPDGDSVSVGEMSHRTSVSGGGKSVRTGTAGGGSSLVGAGGSSNTLGPAPVLDHTITYRSIIQARQEMPLVKAQLERHKHNNKTTPYFHDDKYLDIDISSKLPSHYYQDVPCCFNCFKVYTIIDKARAKALKQIAKKRKQGGGSHGKHSDEVEDAEEEKALKEAMKYFNQGITQHHQSLLENVGRNNRRSVSLSKEAAELAMAGGPPKVVSEEEQQREANLKAALEAIDGLTKMDVAEIRTMSKPPAAVEVVLEAVVILLTGKVMSFKEAHRFLGGGEQFLVMLKEFNVSDVTDERLRLIESYVDNPLFRPENVLPISYCASKFCAWVHGIVHAARHERGMTHVRVDVMRGRRAGQPAPPPPGSAESLDNKRPEPSYLKPVKKQKLSHVRGEAAAAAAAEELSFVQKLEKMKAVRQNDTGPSLSRQPGDLTGSAKMSRSNLIARNTPSLKSISRGGFGGDLSKKHSMAEDSMVSSSLLSRSMSRYDPGPSPDFLNEPSMMSTNSLTTADLDVFNYHHDGLGGGGSREGSPTKKLSKREAKALKQNQKKATDRLAAQSASEGSVGLLGTPKEFRCSDGITKMPYLVLGKFSLTVQRCSFVVIHDFFDTCDNTAIMFKPIVARHDGCQVFCFNYPGQANTVWPRLSAAERERGAKEPMLNNDFIADRLNELLKHAEESGDILLSCPFHLVGIGNGASIAAAFCQRYGHDRQYAAGLRSLVSINGFLYPDPQLSSILHSAYQVFESTPHTRPDIPVSYWSRFVFSDDYLTRINPNLALNIYTAVSNPITNEGRAKIAKGCLQHRDMRGCLAPDYVPTATRGPQTASQSSNSLMTHHAGNQYPPVQIPVIMLQSTENALVNASNVDSFLVGRNSKHLWSHMLNIPSDALMSAAFDANAQWVGKLSTSPADYHKYSTLGKPGLKMILESLRNPRGAFSLWTRTGHAVHQEYKAAVLDMLDILACPTDEYVGFNPMESEVKAQTAQQSLLSMTGGNLVEDESSLLSGGPARPPPKVGVLFKIEPPRAAEPYRDTKAEEAEEEEAALLQASENDKEGAAMSHHPPKKTSYLDSLIQEHDLQFEITNPSVNVLTKSFEPDSMSTTVRDSWDDEKQQASSSSVEAEEEEPEPESIVPIVTPVPVKATAPAPAVAEKAKSSKPKEKSVKVQATPSTSEPVNLTELYATERPDVPAVVTVNTLPAPAVARTGSKKKSDLRNSQEIASALEDAAGSEPPAVVPLSTLMDKPYEATSTQKSAHQWTQLVPDASTALELEAELRAKQKEYLELEEKLKRMREEENNARLGRIEEAQEQRRMQYEKEDKQMLAKLQSELDQRQKERADTERQRIVELQTIESVLVQQGLVPSVDEQIDTDTLQQPVLEMAPQRYEDPPALPALLTEGQDVISKLDRMLRDEEDARKKGIMSMEEYEKVKVEMMERQLERDQMLRQLSLEEQEALFEHSATQIQRIGRGYNGRKKAKKADAERQLKRLKLVMVVKIQSVMRMVLGKKRFNFIKDIYLNNIKNAFSATEIQRVYRGHADRRYFKRLRRWVNATHIQRAFRGHLGRRAFNREKTRLELIRKKQYSAAKIQSMWRMKVAKEEYRSLRIHILACIEIQRNYRGYLGRKKMKRRRQWESATPGPERIKLGLVFIEESKQAFERQQEEIDALHRAQERAEARVSHIHAELKDSERELVVLERELQEIDQIERELTTLTHERNLIISGIEDAAGMPRTAAKGHRDLVTGKESHKDNDPIIDRRRKAEAYALEQTIQIKRAEREKKRQELEIEFATVFQEVEKKRKALGRLELSLQDMEATRERKDREFRRLQKNLMQLLLEQKQELDDLREKGIELETATATTAAAAVATAQKAKEHEKRSTAMFSQTEELMKFQFMSMSLSYFSSLNMLKSLRDMNSDTTSAAISMSADAAATAASAAAAANLPNMKKLSLGANDFVNTSIQKKKADLVVAEKAEREFKKAAANPVLDNVRSWTVNDVARWLDSLYLNQYADAFVEASVDGPFLMELREEDLIQVLGIKHKLHVRKIIISREKLKPLSQQELAKKEVVDREDAADKMREEQGVPTLDTVFSQARNGRIKRVEESLNLGFPIDAEDERGNTLLLVAAQNSNKKLAEMLLVRGAAINHQNAQGNTALHFALTFGAEGQLGEYLIEHGADDTIENVEGMTAYDGVAT